MCTHKQTLTRKLTHTHTLIDTSAAGGYLSFCFCMDSNQSAQSDLWPLTSTSCPHSCYYSLEISLFGFILSLETEVMKMSVDQKVVKHADRMAPATTLTTLRAIVSQLESNVFLVIHHCYQTTFFFFFNNVMGLLWKTVDILSQWLHQVAIKLLYLIYIAYIVNMLTKNLLLYTKC